MAHGAHRLLVLTQRARARARRSLGVALAAALGFTAISWVAPLAPAAQAVEDVVEQSVENSVDTPQTEITPAAAAAWLTFDWGLYAFVAGEESTAEVAFTVRDAAGNPVDANELLVVSSGPAQAVSAPRRTALGRYTATVSLGTVAGDFALTASAGSVPLGKAMLRVLPASAQRMEVELDQTTLVADGASATSLRIRFFDRFSNQASGTIERVEASGAPLLTGFPFLQPDGSHLMRLRADVVPGGATVTIVPKGLASHTVRLTLVQAPAETIEVRVADAELVADGKRKTRLTAVVRNQFGQPAAGDKISIESSDPGVGVGEVVANGDGTYSAEVTASTVAGLVTLTATDTSVDPVLSGQASFTQVAGPIANLDPALSTRRIVADGKSTTRLTMTLTDAHGNAIDGRLLRVTSSDPGMTTGLLIGQGNGTYALDVRSSTVAGWATLTVFEGADPGRLLSMLVLEQVAGPVAEVTATLDTSTLVADGASRTQLRIRAADEHGNGVAGVAFAADSGAAGVHIGRLEDHRDGNYTLEVTSSTVAGDAVITVSDNSGNPAATKQVRLRQVAGPAHALAAELAVPALPADGASTTELRAHLVDEHGNPVFGGKLSVASTDPGVRVGPFTDHGDGSYTTKVVSSTRAGEVVLTLIDVSTGVTLFATATLSQLAGAPTTLTAETADGEIVADGAAGTALTARLIDAHGNPIAGAKLDVDASDAGVRVGGVTDNGDGSYTAQVTASTVAGAVTLTVTDASVSPALVQTVALQQRAGAPAAAELVLSDSSLVADGKAETTLRAAVVDEHGNPVPGAPIGAVSTDAGQVIGGATESEPGVYELTLRSSTTPGVSTISVGTFPSPPAVLAAAGGVALTLASAKIAPSVTAGGLERVLATIELRQTAAGVTPEPRPEPKPGLTTNPEPGAPVAKPSVSPKLADSGAGSIAVPAGAALALLILGGAALMLLRGRRGA
ncbi:MAG: invasin domain 3-containing protein [Leucobacter sp.]